MARQYKSDAMASAHDAALGLFDCGLISEGEMREMDELCFLTPVKTTMPNKIKKIRKRESSSRADFAKI